MPSMTTAACALLFCPLAAVLAQGCDATFAKKGNAITGLKFSARHTVADLSTPDAINQLRGIVVSKGYDVLATEPEAGDMLLEMPQNANQRSFPLVAKATSDGAAVTVELRANLRAGVMTKEELVKTELCSLLSALKGGAAGTLAASEGKTASAAGTAPTVLSAQILADRLSKERDKNVSEIPLRYKDRAFTLDGTVASVSRDGDSYHVVFEIIPWERKVIKLPGDSQFKTDIVCVLATGQSVYALTLKPRSKVKLTGTYADYRESSGSTMWLSNCRPEK
jgi:hypothetical protein